MGLDQHHVRHSLGCPPNAFPDLLRGQRPGEWVQSSVRDFVGAIKINLKRRLLGLFLGTISFYARRGPL
jgi:hypothetical protein